MPQLVIEVSDLQLQCLAVDCYDPLEWATNAVLNRARISYEALLQVEIQRRFAAGEPILSDRDSNLVDAFSRGIILSAKQKSAQKEQDT